MVRRSRSVGTVIVASAVLLLGASFAKEQLGFAAPPGGQVASTPSTGGTLAGSEKLPLQQLPSSKVATAAGAAKLSPKQAYITGISWYLMHFVVSIGNDGIMKFLGDSLPAFQIVCLRFSAAAAVLLPVLLIKGKEAFKSARLSMHAVRGLLLAVGIGLWCVGLNMMPFASCVVINNTMPFFKMAFAQVILGEKVGKERWLASLAGFIGCLIVFNPTAATFKPQSLVLIFSAMCFAMLDIFNKKYSTSESITSMLFYGSVATAVIAAFKAVPTWVPVTAPQLGLIAVLGVGANVLLYCLLKAFNYVDASATCPYRYTEFVLSAVVGFLLFKECPSKSTFLGSCIILPSVIYTAMVETREAPSESSEDTKEAVAA